jgi:hypothetical protein
MVVTKNCQGGRHIGLIFDQRRLIALTRRLAAAASHARHVRQVTMGFASDVVFKADMIAQFVHEAPGNPGCNIQDREW